MVGETVHTRNHKVPRPGHKTHRSRKGPHTQRVNRHETARAIKNQRHAFTPCENWTSANHCASAYNTAWPMNACVYTRAQLTGMGSLCNHTGRPTHEPTQAAVAKTLRHWSNTDKTRVNWKRAVWIRAKRLHNGAVMDEGPNLGMQIH